MATSSFGLRKEIGLLICGCAIWVGIVYIYCDRVAPCTIPLGTENLIRIAAYGATIIIGVLSFLLIRPQGNVSSLIVIILFSTLAILVLKLESRQTDIRLLSWEFNGNVDQVYRSENHNARSMIVSGKKFEDVPETFWSSIRVNSQVSKQHCENIAFIDGVRLDFDSSI